MPEKPGFLESFSPWTSRSNTPKPTEEAETSKSHTQVEKLAQRQTKDHATSTRHRISPRDYPSDCPKSKIRWFYAVDVRVCCYALPGSCSFLISHRRRNESPLSLTALPRNQNLFQPPRNMPLFPSETLDRSRRLLNDSQRREIYSHRQGRNLRTKEMIPERESLAEN